jgi:hypothetical protein
MLMAAMQSPLEQFFSMLMPALDGCDLRRNFRDAEEPPRSAPPGRK